MTDDPDIRMASSVMDYIFRRLALDHLPFETRAEMGILSAKERAMQVNGEDPASLHDDDQLRENLAQSAEITRPAAPRQEIAAPAVSPEAHSSMEVIESRQGRTADAPLCLTCGTKMRPAGSCYVCEGCGSTSGCS
jgi:ribonucleoside-diphosphate reductase alpha chain